jgi:hypothetical protein
MTCEDCRAMLALDEGSGEAAEHVKGCEECRWYEAGLAADRVVLAGMREPPAEAYAAVRAWVMAEVRRGRRRPVWPWVAAAACVLAAVVGALVRAPLREPVRPEPVLFAVNPPVGWDVVRVARRRVVRRRAPAALREPLRIEIQTADPNVVVIWLVDREKGTS